MNWKNAIALSAQDARQAHSSAEESRTRAAECTELARQAVEADEGEYWTARAEILRNEAESFGAHAACLDALVEQARRALERHGGDASSS